MLFQGNERREREREMRQAGRLPPGQSLTLKWPVLHYGSVPRFDLDRDNVLFATHHDGEPLPRRSWLSAAADRAAPLCLEIAEVGSRPGISRPRSGRLL